MTPLVAQWPPSLAVVRAALPSSSSVADVAPSPRVVVVGRKLRCALLRRTCALRLSRQPRIITRAAAYDNKEAVVVGGGPAGLASAIALAKRGWKRVTVRVVACNAVPFRLPSSHSLYRPNTARSEAFIILSPVIPTPARCPRDGSSPNPLASPLRALIATSFRNIAYLAANLAIAEAESHSSIRHLEHWPPAANASSTA